MTDYLPRSAWDARPPTPGPGRLNPAQVRGVAFHWPGATTRRPISKAAVPRALRSWQDYHMTGRGWSDIAYQIAVDQWGRAWTLRGLETQSGANGDRFVNERYCAVLLVLVTGERPSSAMLTTARAVVADARELYPNARRLVGHRQIRPEPTSCPGPAVMAALRAGQLDPRNYPGEDDMPTVDEFWHHRITTNDHTGRPKDNTRTAEEMLAQAHRRSGDARTQAARNARALRKLTEHLAPDVAAAVIEELGDEYDVTLTVDAPEG